MSYQSFKRLLGETHIERKCRFLLGAGVITLMGLSFWAYARQAESLAYEQMVATGRLLVPPILAREHLHADRQAAIRDFQESSEKTWPDTLSEYRYKIIKPNAKLPEHKPEGEELSVLNRLLATSEPEDGLRSPDSSVFHYYGLIRASASCVECHNKHPEAIAAATGPIQEGDTMAVVKVTLSTKAIETGVHMNRALLLSFALLTAILIMAGSYLIIRYVVVKPLKHLKHVSDAIGNGELNVRCEIHTGDEFEDLSEAFNRMLRYLMAAGAEQQKLNADLDARLDELARANMALYESNKAKSDFLSTVSHELRTPLNGIIGFSDVLLAGSNALTEKQARWVVNIKTSGQQLLTLINDILDLAKIEAGRMAVKADEFAVRDICDGLLPSFRIPAEKKNIDLLFQYDSAVQSIKQDAGKIRQILTNLLSNAIKFTPEGGRVSLRVQVDGTMILFIISDTGVGIAPDEQERIFEKFRQTGSTLTREHEGTGLGLSIVRELCVLLGGEVQLKSDLGRGSVFTVRLPCTYNPQPKTDFRHVVEELGLPSSKSSGELRRPILPGPSATSS